MQTDADTAHLSLLTAQQTLAASRSALADLEAEEDQLGLDIDDAGRATRTAARALADLTITAGLSGTYHGTVPVIGDALSNGEELGTITDLDALEVRLDLTAREIARVSAVGGLMPLKVSLSTPGTPRQYEAQLHHVSLTASDDIGTARQVVAWLEPGACPCPLPGEFVLANIQEPALRDVTLLPASAVTLADEVLVPDADNRLQTRKVERLRAMGDFIAVAPVDFDYVVQRSPQIGAGLVISPQWPEGDAGAPPEADDTTTDAHRPASPTAPARAGNPEREPGQPRAGPAGGPGGGPAVTLAPERRAALIARIKASDTMPERQRDRALQVLAQDSVPEAFLQRLETQD
ncbi:hypothetical protein PSAL_035110 [Pseudooceanicola algae]|uniref:HlyD family secretion protein n=1 Tax=Pseudooceanicola algae TaxID=1537215 RepID=A0A7T1BXG8_9RHOB|nr:hypothetical protein PSAL_035110 [Pseudooceanicola algae]